jgi:hypothetical protein
MLSHSPSGELLPMVPGMQRQSSGYGYPLQQMPGLPMHLRGMQIKTEYPHAPRSISPLNGLSSLQHYTSAPQLRAATSHPSFAGPPPQPIEPPANGTASGGASPHLSAPTWSTSVSGTLPPPTSMESWPGAGSAYPDLGYNHQQYNSHLYYANGVGARPMSTEPKDYGLQMHQQQHMAPQMHGDPKEYEHLHQQPQNMAPHMSFSGEWGQMNTMTPHPSSTPRPYAS